MKLLVHSIVAISLLSTYAAIAGVQDLVTLDDYESVVEQVVAFDKILEDENNTSIAQATKDYATLVAYLSKQSTTNLHELRAQLLVDKASADAQKSTGLQVNPNGATIVAINAVLSYTRNVRTRATYYFNMINEDDPYIHRAKPKVTLEELSNFLAVAPHITKEPITSVNLSPFTISFLPVTILQIASLEKIYLAPHQASIPRDKFVPSLSGETVPEFFGKVEIVQLADDSSSEEVPAPSADDLEPTVDPDAQTQTQTEPKASYQRSKKQIKGRKAAASNDTVQEAAQQEGPKQEDDKQPATKSKKKKKRGGSSKGCALL